MPVVHTADAYAVEQVSIERIELGDLIRDRAAKRRTPLLAGEAKRFNYVAGESTEDRGPKRQPESVATHAAGCEATVSTLVYRIIPAPRQQHEAAKAPAGAPDNTNASKTSPTKIDKLT